MQLERRLGSSVISIGNSDQSSLATPREPEIHGMEAWKEILELAVGNPLVILYLAYIAGLLITIAAVKVSSSSQKP
jgi:hypothetical protein